MDRTSAAAGLVLAAVLLLSSLATVPQPAAAQVGTSTLSGDVCSVDHEVTYIQAPEPGDAAGCGLRLPGATLRLTKAGVGGTAVGAVDKTATSDGNGSFQFTGLADGTYTLSVARTGYTAVDLTVQVAGNTGRTVGLKPQVVAVSGTVVDPSGAPAAGAHVAACCGPTVGGTEATADRAGAFTLKTESGERTFTVGVGGRTLLSQALFVDGSKPVRLVVPAAPAPDAILHGAVTDQDGRPLAGIPLNIYSYGGCCDGIEPMPMPATQTGTSAPTASGGGSSDMAASPAIYRPCCYGGGTTATTDAGGRYSVRLYGGATVSVSIYQEGFAGYSKSFELGKGEDRTLDIRLLRFPAKTAHLEGRVVDAATGDALPYVFVSVQSPAYGLYECSQEAGREGGTTATAAPPSPESSGTVSSGSVSPGTASTVVYPGPPYDNGCAIRVGPDGAFRGNVTPGYAIVQVGYESWRACPREIDDGTYRPCLPEYYAWTQTMDLPAGQTTTLTVRLQQRPGPDAVVSGYLVDAATGQAIPGGQVSFSNEDSYGYGFATTDQDGSYRIRVRSGHLSVYASAEGHLHWVGMLDAASGETPFDIRLTPGEDAHGGCCMIAYAAKGMDVAAGAPMAAGSGGSGTGGSGTQGPQSRAEGSSSANAAFEDLHGGLGPYDAAARSQVLEEANSSPAAGAALLVALMGCALLARRRRR